MKYQELLKASKGLPVKDPIAALWGRIRELTYRRVEYLKSTGTQIVVTDIIPTLTERYELDLKFTASEQAGGNRAFFGCRRTVSGSLYTIFACNWAGGQVTDQGFYAYTFHTSSDGAFTQLPSSVKVNRNTLTLFNSSGTYGDTQLTAVTATSPTDIDLPVALFGLVNGETSSEILPYSDSPMTLYSFKVFNGNELRHNLVPVEREDGELGLLDTITNKFYANAGTGTFEKGGYLD